MNRSSHLSGTLNLIGLRKSCSGSENGTMTCRRYCWPRVGEFVSRVARMRESRSRSPDWTIVRGEVGDRTGGAVSETPNFPPPRSAKVSYRDLAMHIQVPKGTILYPAAQSGDLGKAYDEFIRKPPGLDDCGTLKTYTVDCDEYGKVILYRPISTLIDSGADDCFISTAESDLLHSHSARYPSLRKFAVKGRDLKTAKAGSQMQILHAHTLHFRIRGTTMVFTQTFYVAPIHSFQRILGGPWLRKSRCVTRSLYYAVEWPLSDGEIEGVFCSLEQIYRSQRPRQWLKLVEAAERALGNHSAPRTPRRAPQ